MCIRYEYISIFVYGAGIVEYDCHQHKDFVDENQGQVLTGE